MSQIHQFFLNLQNMVDKFMDVITHVTQKKLKLRDNMELYLLAEFKH
jgi:hypothetical protein